MPKLLLFAPCEKVIIANDNTISLLTVFEEMQIKIPRAQEEKLPANAQIPLKWFVLCLWQAAAGEENASFEQLMNVILPGEKSLQQITQFKFTKPHHRVVNQLLGFPITPAGSASIAVSLRASPDKEWEPYAEYPLLIKRPVE